MLVTIHAALGLGVISTAAAMFSLSGVAFDETAIAIQEPEPKKNIHFRSNRTSDRPFIRSGLQRLEYSMNETFKVLLPSNVSMKAEFFTKVYKREIDQSYFHTFLSMSLSDSDREKSLEECQRLSKKLAVYWEELDQDRIPSLDHEANPDFAAVSAELEKEKTLAIERLFDVNRYLGSTEIVGKQMNKMLHEIQKNFDTDKYFGIPEYRYATTLYSFLKEVAQIFLDYNNLFRMPEGVLLSVQEQFQRNLKDYYQMLNETTIEDVGSEPFTDAKTDASLVFRLLPLFRDPIGEVFTEIDFHLTNIRNQYFRLGMAANEIEACFIKIMRTRFEKVWYSIDWVLQYVNFIYVKTGGQTRITEAPDYSVAGYIHHFAEWADAVRAWKIGSLDSRLLGFTIRSLQSELESSEVFRGIKIGDYEPKTE